MLKVGQTALDFTARTTQGRVLRLAELRGRFVVLYFFPKAFTPGCTKEAGAFRDAYAELSALGAEVIGASTDDERTMCDFANATHVPFPMLGEGNRLVAAMYQVSWPLLKLPRRITFIIDPEGVIRAVFHHELQVGRHVDDVRRTLLELHRARRA